MIIVIVVVDYRGCVEGSKLVGKTLSVVPGTVYCSRSIRALLSLLLCMRSADYWGWPSLSFVALPSELIKMAF